MNVGIIAPSGRNPYAAALVAKLAERGHTPRLLLCAERSQGRTVLDYWRANGFRPTVRRALQQFRLADPSGPDPRPYLQEQLAADGITGWDQPLRRLSRRWSIDYIRVRSANEPRAVEHVCSRHIDVLLNAGGEILRRQIIRSPTLGILNAHMAPLPAFRGMNVLEWSVFEGEPIGVTIHFIDEGIDTGNVLLFRELPVTAGDTLDTLRAKSITLAVGLMAEAVALLAANRTRPLPQSRPAGRQFFVMHPRLRAVVERKLHKRQAQIM